MCVRSGLFLAVARNKWVYTRKSFFCESETKSFSVVLKECCSGAVVLWTCNGAEVLYTVTVNEW